MRCEKKMAMFILGLVVGLAISSAIEALYNRICPFSQSECVDNWDEKRVKYGVSYKDFK